MGHKATHDYECDSALHGDDSRPETRIDHDDDGPCRGWPPGWGIFQTEHGDAYLCPECVLVCRGVLGERLVPVPTA